MNAWDSVKDKLEDLLSSESFQNWVSKTKFSGSDGHVLKVSVPDQQTRKWMQTEYGGLVRKILGELHLEFSEVDYQVEKSRVPVAASSMTDDDEDDDGPSEERLERDADPDSPLSSLNPRFTFENYVVGSSTQFAAPAARSVAMNPSRSYNPLFIYGGVGMGKTHLMHAIGRSLVLQGKLKVVYTSSERFTNEVVTGIRLARIAQFA